MSKNTEITKLRNGLARFLQPIVDEGTWKPRSKKHHLIRCKYKGCPLEFTFPLSPKPNLSMVAVIKQVDLKLAKCGLFRPSKRKIKMMVPGDVDYYLDQLFDFLEEQEQLSTSSDTGVGDANRYIKKARTTQRARVRSITSKKPYKKKISYDVLGGEVSYDRYYSWMRKKFKDGRVRNGFMQVSKGTYLEALVIWKNKDK